MEAERTADWRLAQDSHDVDQHSGDFKLEGEIKRTAGEDLEQQRFKQAATEIRKIDFMESEKWKSLDQNERISALKYSGKALGDAYHSPDPPLLDDKWSPEKLGAYGDGYSSDSKGNIIGSDYGIRINRDGIDSGNEKLFGDDPKTALKTYSHEFRHSYQREQATAYEKGIVTDDPVKAREWSESYKYYKDPPEAAMAKNDPEQYFQKYEEYCNQPVEKDARKFSERLVSEVYDKKPSSLPDKSRT